MRSVNGVDIERLRDIWAFPASYGSWNLEAPDIVCADWRVFANIVINACTYESDAMPLPSWLDKVKSEIKTAQPSTLQEGRTEFKAATMTEPKMSGKFRKYAFQCKTRAGATVNLSVSSSLLQRILDVVQAGTDFAITKQGTGLDTNYVVEALQ